MANTELLIRTYTVIDTTIDEEASELPYERGATSYTYRDYEVPIGRVGYTPIAVAGTSVRNATDNGKNASAVKVSWAYLDADKIPQLLHVRLKTDSKKKSVVKCKAQILYARSDIVRHEK